MAKSKANTKAKTILWHEECLANSEWSLERLREQAALEIARFKSRIEQSEKRNAEYRAQIELAKKEGKDEFDAEKYGKRRIAAK